jgi:hypothetical protein
MNDNIRTVSFIMTDEDSQHTFSRNYADLDPWSYILQDFLSFLEGAGFSGITKRVSVENSPFIDERWYGPVHDAEE